MKRTAVNKMKKAFTLLEVVMVIVILGIVSSIASTIIADVYDNYLIQRATYRASLKTELAAQQIANMLSYRIKNTTLAKNPTNLNDYILVTDGTNLSDNTHTVLEWIGYDHDSFEAANLPGWDGFCDVNASVGGIIITPGSNLNLAQTIMNNITRNDVPNNQSPAIFFNDYLYRFTPDVEYNVACMGLIDNNTSCISSVNFTANEEQMNFNLNAATPNKLIVEHYKLAASAYALWPAPNPRTGNFDLRLYYNYQPWAGERLAANNTYSTLISNVTVFKFAEMADTFRFKLCAQESIGTDYNITICKEKAIIL